MNHEPIYNQEAIFVEGSVPLAHAESPEQIDTENYIFSGQSNFPQTDARFGANRPYNLRRDHLALAPENSVYNALQPKQQEEPAVTVITYFPLDHYIEPELQIEADNDDSDETENQPNTDTDSLHYKNNINNHDLWQDWDVSFDPNYTPLVNNTNYSRYEYGDYTTDFTNAEQIHQKILNLTNKATVTVLTKIRHRTQITALRPTSLNSLYQKTSIS